MSGLPLCGAVVTLLCGIAPIDAQAASCTFSKDLEPGTVGADVLCLQQYLNTNGFVIAEAGAGALGKETDEFKTLTKAAVIKWQVAHNISPASGYFGPKSRAMYKSLITGVTTPSTGSSSVGTGNTLIDQLLSQIETIQKQQQAKATTSPAATEKVPPVVAGETVTRTAAETEVRTLMGKIIDAIEDAESEIDDSDDKSAIKEGEENLVNAREDLFAGLRNFTNEDYTKTKKRFTSALEWAQDALAAVAGDSEKTKAKDLIKEVDKRMQDIQDELDDADLNRATTRDIEDLLGEAQDTLSEAEDAYDDEDYKDAYEYAKDTDDLLDEAEDLL